MSGGEWIVVGCVAVAGGLTDLATGRIPNVLTGPLVMAGLVWAVLQGGLSGLASSAGACLLLTAPFVVLFVMAGGGAGDAKLMGAIGAWVGMENWLVVLMCVVLSGLVLAVGYAAVHGRIRTVAANVARIIGGLFVFLFTRRWSVARVLVPDASEMQAMPYGLAICLGVWAAAGYQLLWQR